MSFLLSGDSIKIIPGVPFTLKASYGYNGADPRQNSGLSFDLPAGLNVVTATPGHQASGRKLGWNLGTLVRGDTGQKQFTLVYSGTAPAGTLENVAGEFTADSVGPLVSSWPLTVETSAGLKTSVTAPVIQTGQGDTVTWSIRVSNQSAVQATGVTLDVTLPPTMYNHSFYFNEVSKDYFNPPYTSPSYSSLSSGTVATYSIGALAPGANRLFQIALKAAYRPADEEIFAVSARANSNNGVASSEAQAAVSYAESDLSFLLSGDSIKIIPGVPFTLKASYGYNGADPRQNSGLSFDLPAGLNVVTATPGHQASGRKLGWNLGTLVRGDTGQKQFTLVYSGTAPAGTLENVAGEFTADSVGPLVSSWPLTVETSAGLKTSVTAPVIQTGQGDTVTWSIRVSNQSAVQATGVTLDVTLPPTMYNHSFYFNEVSKDYFNPPYTSPSYSSLSSGTVATYSIGALAPGANHFFRIDLKAAYAPADRKIFAVSARASSNNGVASSEAQAAVSYAGSLSYSPTIGEIPDQEVDENGTIDVGNISLGDLDGSPNALTLTVGSSDQNLVVPGNVVISGSGSTRTLSISPAPNKSGSCYLSVYVHDGKSTSESRFRLTINPANSAPTVSRIPDTQITANSAPSLILFDVSDPDNDPSTLTARATSSNTTLVAPSGIILGGTGVSRTLSLTPVPNQTGSSVITLTVSDGALTASSSFTLTVVPGEYPLGKRIISARRPSCRWWRVIWLIRTGTDLAI